eukprot:Skav231349  [mRNA]  locus=scaffold223:22613:29531:+ [translate_table: standard]
MYIALARVDGSSSKETSSAAAQFCARTKHNGQSRLLMPFCFDFVFSGHSMEALDAVGKDGPVQPAAMSSHRGSASKLLKSLSGSGH